MTQLNLQVDPGSPAFQDRIAQACGDPGSIVGRQAGESLSRWCMRAVLHILAETAAVGAGNRFCTRSPFCRMADGHEGGCQP